MNHENITEMSEFAQILCILCRLILHIVCIKATTSKIYFLKHKNVKRSKLSFYHRTKKKSNERALGWNNQHTTKGWTE